MTTPEPQPKRYVVPYPDDGSWPRIYEWAEGVTDTQDETGQWRGEPVPYAESLTWRQAKAKLDQVLKLEAKQLRDYRARWRDAEPDEAVTPYVH